MNVFKIKILLLSVFLLPACNESVLVPEQIPVEVLRSAPDTINVEGEKIILNTYLWRDFMPVSPPDGKPLIALVVIESLDSSDISGLIRPEAIYIVNGNEVWNSFFLDEIPPDSNPYSIKRIAKDGPKWGPGIFVDVVVSINAGSERKLLQAPGQYIHRTD